ncbi:hypothetical protein [Actinophytocola oryzae]|uniref:Uncharacterized protein n=1 Tax=Actinophytocola oryzae TaxID=502181 RepID=A0A4R7US50_9PSEU|nr:hypothetical protein [Actinophytocola oryzae]TDV38583.1 hypothetical protein CLV71_12726 [Actinophytocola oryzae]
MKCRPPAGARATVLGTGDEVSWRVSCDDVEVRLPELGDAAAPVVSFTVR